MKLYWLNLVLNVIKYQNKIPLKNKVKYSITYYSNEMSFKDKKKHN